MNRLFDNVIAREPGKMPPIAHLPFRIGLTGLLWERAPNQPGIVIRVQRPDVTDGALVNLLHDGADSRVIAIAEAGHEGEVLLLGFATAFENGADTRRVCRHRLLTKDVL